jgi:hypothetical protein
MSLLLKQTERFMYNWTNRTVEDFVKAVVPTTTPTETKAVVDVTPSSDVILNTTATKTIFNLGVINGNNVNNITIALGNPGQQQIGDTLVLMLSVINSSVSVFFNSTYFYHQTTGNQNNFLPFLNAGERSVTIFTFDGVKFVCTNDNG